MRQKNIPLLFNSWTCLNLLNAEDIWRLGLCLVTASPASRVQVKQEHFNSGLPSRPALVSQTPTGNAVWEQNMNILTFSQYCTRSATYRVFSHLKWTDRNPWVFKDLRRSSNLCKAKGVGVLDSTSHKVRASKHFLF